MGLAGLFIPLLVRLDTPLLPFNVNSVNPFEVDLVIVVCTVLFIICVVAYHKFVRHEPLF